MLLYIILHCIICHDLAHYTCPYARPAKRRQSSYVYIYIYICTHTHTYIVYVYVVTITSTITLIINY